MSGLGYSPSSMMYPYDVPISQPYPYAVPVPQPYFENIVQPIDMPIQHTIQPVLLPTPVGVPFPQPVPIPYDRPYAVPYPQPVPYPVDRPCAVPVPVPVGVPFPQPYAVPQPILVREQIGIPVPVPYAVPMQTPRYTAQRDYIPSSSYRCVERIIEQPIYAKRSCRRRRRRHRSCSPRPAPLAPIVIPIMMPAPAAAQQQVPLQITEYIQDIYPPAQVYTEQVPVGYETREFVVQKSGQIQQISNNVQSNLSPYSNGQQQQQQFVQRQMGVGGGQRVFLPESSSMNTFSRDPRIIS